MTTPPPHRTPSERRAHAHASAAIARAQAHTRQATDDQAHEQYPVTPAIARLIRQTIDADRATEEQP